jgi:hypothetical protein
MSLRHSHITRTVVHLLLAAVVPLLLAAGASNHTRRVVVIGASVSDGFGVRLRTAREDGRTVVVGVDMRTLLRAAARDADTAVLSHASSMYFSDPARFARESVRKAIADKPSLVLAVDWLFWNAYGTDGVRMPQARTCEERLQQLERGLNELAPLADSGVPLVLGDLPDMQAAVGGGMLSQVMVPDPACLAQLNARVREWCSKRPNVMLVNLADVVQRVLDGKPVRACNRDWCETDLGPLLQRDRLHPTLNGTLAVVAAALEAADRGTNGEASKAFDLDPGTIRERVGKVAAAETAENGKPAPAAVSPASEGPAAPPAAAGSGSNRSP